MMSHAQIDRLETRRLFAVSLDAGTLNVTGTAGNDVITVYIDPSNPGNIDVKLNKVVTTFDAAAVTAVFVRGYRGHDILHTAVGAPVRMYGDAGGDFLFVEGAPARIFRGDG